MDIRTAIIFLPGFLAGITIHEAAHALASKWLGDRFAQRQGRISLNPMRHLSASGTLLLFLVGIGWGKPVPVNLYNYKHPRLYNLISSLAGPLSNILLVCVLILVGLVLARIGFSTDGTTFDILTYAIIINLFLAFINMIPIPPLDGSAIWPCLIPALRPVYSGKAMSFWFIVLLLIFLFQIPTKIAAYAGQQMSAFARERMEQKRVSLPEDFPEELRVPRTAFCVRYNKIDTKAREPNVFTATYYIDQCYPAVRARDEISNKMREMGWITQEKDPNIWEEGCPLNINGNPYKTIIWNREWNQKNKTFRVEIKYYIDPNSKSTGAEPEILYRYTIKNKQT